MANELCASGFGGTIDGQYNLMYTDHWFNGTYWLYKDSFNWMISDSEFLYEATHLVAKKPYVTGSWADGNYQDPNGAPTTGIVTLGTC